ncbi:MAG: hypothetical protein K0Q55_2452 [Verrucomicrobia bacterium]|nr:hypothetical protein [Verrucomicrobiota bacterium]
MQRTHQFIACFLFLFAVSAVAQHPDIGPAHWVYLDNGQVRLGVKKSSGAGIAYLSLSGSERNLLNHFDHGRLVQQSYYGKEDGTLWAGKPWRWNPVQGGDYKHGAAKVLELKSDKTTLYAKSLGRHWSGCVDLPEVTFEQWITLTGKVAHVRYKLTYTGTNSHPKVHQEVPAVFVEPDLHALVTYIGTKPWTGDALQTTQPGWPNEYKNITENWAAYVDKDNFGVGAYVPIASKITCYRYNAGGTTKQGACSYFAPIIDLAIVPGTVFEYDLYLTLGQPEEMRETFKKIRDRKAK